MLLLMLMVVAVGASMILLMALRVPAFSTEIRAYLGKRELDVDADVSRRAHLFFLMYLYASPLGLGILVYLIHYATRWLSSRSVPQRESDEFEMTPGSTAKSD